MCHTLFHNLLYICVIPFWWKYITIYSLADFFLSVSLGIGRTDTLQATQRKSISTERTFSPTGDGTLIYQKLGNNSKILNLSLFFFFFFSVLTTLLFSSVVPIMSFCMLQLFCFSNVCIMLIRKLKLNLVIAQTQFQYFQNWCAYHFFLC